MLTPLGSYLVFVLMACSMALLIVQASETANAEVVAVRSRPINPESALDPAPPEWRPYSGFRHDFEFDWEFKDCHAA
jgi:hypothetical protein